MKNRNRTNRKKWKEELQTPAGLTSVAFGVISLLLFAVAVRLSYRQEGLGTMMVGAIGLFAFLFAITGMGLAGPELRKEDHVSGVAKLGMLVSVVATIFWVVIFLYGLIF